MKLAVAVFALVLIAPLSAREKLEGPVESEKLIMEPFKVRGKATSNFAIDIQIVKDERTGKVIRIMITAVLPDSDAVTAGLRAGDEIVAIDDVPVAGMDGKIDIASQIGQIFLNRRPGEELRLDVMMRRSKKVTLRASNIDPRWKLPAP